MKVLFTFENALPSTQADAEVFITTARYLLPFSTQSWLHLPASGVADCVAASAWSGLPVIRAYAPRRPAILRHFCCGLTLVFRAEFRQADLVYTRNLWVAWMALLFGKPVVFDHYRPWPDQIPPLQPWIRRLICHRRFLVNICHSRYTQDRYLEIGAPPEKLSCVWNGFEPQRLLPRLSLEDAKKEIGAPSDKTTIIYTGRINHKKGLTLVIEAAKRLPDLLFILVGATGESSVETAMRAVENIRLVPWQSPEALRRYIFAADILLIPPSWQPLASFGSTVLPLKLFLYMASRRPIVAGSTPDIRELLRHDENAFLCRPDCLNSLTTGLKALTSDKGHATRLAETALADSRDLTWNARAIRIADIITQRRYATPGTCRRRSRLQHLAWLRQSCRWFAHLVSAGSWVLPPRTGLHPADPAGADEKTISPAHDC